MTSSTDSSRRRMSYGTANDSIGARHKIGRDDHQRRSRASSWRAIIVTLLLLPLLGIVAFRGWQAVAPVTNISDTELVGPRPPVPVSLVLLLDDSASFEPYAEMRSTALDEVITWAPQNLRPDDTLTVITFTSGADVLLPTSTMGDLAAGGAEYLPTSRANGTLILPALRKAAEVVPDGATTSLIVVTDTVVSDPDAAAVRTLAKEMNATTMSVITPKGVKVDPHWKEAFSWEAAFKARPSDPEEIAVAVGKAVSHATGQSLQKKERSDD